MIIDDRPDRAGVKFSDAELVGIPFRITIGKRGVAAGTAELTDRATGETVVIPLDDVAKHVREAVTAALPPNARVRSSRSERTFHRGAEPTKNCHVL